MLATLNDVLGQAKKGGYAVGLFNTVNLEMARGVIAAAEAERSPVIIGTAEVLLPYGPLEELSWFLIPLAKRASVPVVVHLDHGLDPGLCLAALELGFSSIMYDGSTLPYAENLRMTAVMARAARSAGASIEAELGHVGDAGGSLEGGPAQGGAYTDPEEARAFVKATGVDALAIAVGTAHGHYKAAPVLDFERISRIAAAASDAALVLHGGSGLSPRDFSEAIARGIAKINVFTDLDAAGAAAASKALDAGAKSLTGLINPIAKAVEEATREKMRLFGSSGKA